MSFIKGGESEFGVNHDDIERHKRDMMKGRNYHFEEIKSKPDLQAKSRIAPSERTKPNKRLMTDEEKQSMINDLIERRKDLF